MTLADRWTINWKSSKQLYGFKVFLLWLNKPINSWLQVTQKAPLVLLFAAPYNRVAGHLGGIYTNDHDPYGGSSESSTQCDRHPLSANRQRCQVFKRGVLSSTSQCKIKNSNKWTRKNMQTETDFHANRQRCQVFERFVHGLECTTTVSWMNSFVEVWDFKRAHRFSLFYKNLMGWFEVS